MKTPFADGGTKLAQQPWGLWWVQAQRLTRIELRRNLDIAEKDGLEIYIDNDRIILRKYEPACVFCGNADKVTKYKNKNICEDCLTTMQKPVF